MDDNKINNGEYFESFNPFQKNKITFLPTAMVIVQAQGDIYGPFKALCDTGSVPNLISFALDLKFKNLLISSARK